MTLKNYIKHIEIWNKMKSIIAVINVSLKLISQKIVS